MKTTYSNLFDGAEELTKKCGVCSQALPLTMFSKASGGNYLRTECRLCSKALNRARDLAKASAPRIPQNYKCPICYRTEDQVRHKGGKKSGSWCCDHDHSTGVFRGWLCHDCNRAIGSFKDDIPRIKRAIDYLTK